MTTEEQNKWVKDQMHGTEIVVNNASSKGPKVETIYKYSNKGKGQPREAVIIEGKPYLLKYSEKSGFLTVEPYIDEPTRKLLPPHEEEYPYDAYIFNDVKEPNYYLQRAKKETVDTLYRKIKSVFGKFNDIDEQTLNLFSADLLATYFQDRFSTVHYIIVVGDNGTGKSALADTFEALGYRSIVMTNPTKAIWYRVLGDIEYGQVTIIADESEGIEDNLEIMSILKDGYQTKHKVPRMDSDNKKPEWYYPFCFKIIICEKSPAEYKAKGLLDRSFKIKTFKGYPEYDIKEVRNPQGNKLRQRLLDEIEDLRKLLLVFKLYHREPLPEIDIGLDGRDKELCKPLIQLFYGSESQKEIEETLQYFIDIKNERKKDTREAVIYPLVVNAISENGSNEIASRKLYELVTQNLDGNYDPDNADIFQSTGFGKIYINTISKIACDKFGAESKHGRKSNSIVFNEKSLAKMSKVYGSANKIETKLVECEGCEGSEAPWRDGKAFNMLNDDEKDRNIDKNMNNLHEIRPEIDNISDKDLWPDPVSASHASHASQQEYPQDCYYCDHVFNGIGRKEYENHVIQKHPGKPCYPGLADMKLYKIKPKGMTWE